MKSICFLSVLFSLLTAPAGAQALPDGSVSADSVCVERQGGYLHIRMNVDLDGLEVEGNQAVLLTPCLRQGKDSLELRSIGVYGRKRYYAYIRNGESLLTGPKELTYKRKEMPSEVAYADIISYDDWMDGAEVVLRRQDYGCCGSLLVEQWSVIGGYKEAVVYVPRFVYVQPQVETVKTRSLDKSAYIDFPVSRTDIRPGYRNNRVELDKILATIDSIRGDADITLTSLSIKGFASPEGSYANNERLARERTEALRKYVSGLYHFPDTFIRTSYEPENWEGLREYVEASSLENKQDILRLIDDNSLKPDAKERKIRAAYPADYAQLLRECYPALRRSDYHIEYVIRSYTDVEEIKRILCTQPQKLSRQEFYMAAQTMEPGSDAFNEVFETAVRMYPDDEVTNLNAANTAMRKGDLPAAARYLQKAGNSPQAIYARGVYAMLTEDYAKARTLMEDAQAQGVAEAGSVLEQLERIDN